MDSKMAMSDLVKSFCQREKLTVREGDAFVRAFFETLERCLLREKLVKVKGLGTFKVVDVAERDSVDVNTGERIRIQGHGKITFTPDAELRDRVNKPFAAFDTIILNELTNIDDMTRIPNDDDNEEEEGADGEDETFTGTVDVAPVTEEEVPPAEEEIPVTVSDENITDTENGNPVAVAEEEAEPAKEVLATKTEEAGGTVTGTVDETPVAEKEAEPAPSEEVPKEEETVQDNPENQDTFPDTAEKNEHVQWWYLLFFAFILGMMLLSYFVGYYRLLCPCMTTVRESAEQVTVQKQQPPTVEKPAMTADSLDASEPKEAGLNDKPEKDTVQMPPTAGEYAQVPGGKYTIVGTRGEHVMAVGDNLYKIARKEYGDRDMAQYIITHNQFRNPDVIPLGYKVKLPELKKNSEEGTLKEEAGSKSPQK